MAVDTFQLHRLAVNIKISAGYSELIVCRRSVLNLYFAKSYICRHCFKHFSFLVGKLTYKGVSPRRFRTPLVRIVKSKCRLYFRFGALCHIYGR